MNYNYEAIGKVYQFLSQHPEKLLMNKFLDRSECGTVACLAGWTCILFDPQYSYQKCVKENAPYFVGTAQEILRISNRETAIFDAGNDENAVLEVLGELLRQKDLPIFQRETIEQIAQKHDIWFDEIPPRFNYCPLHQHQNVRT